MNNENCKINENLLPSVYVKQARDSLKAKDNAIQNLLDHQKIPDNGWSDATIEYFLLQLSSMDSNNFLSNCGLGERESRIASSLVAKRHYYLGHGIGRSGDLTEVQPKAAGSSLIYKLTNKMLEDLFKTVGMQDRVKCILTPVATGMSIVLSLLSFKALKPNSKYVIWSRIDQKSCFKSIVSAGFIPIIINCNVSENGFITNTKKIEEEIEKIGNDNISCIISTTSCFAPRKCDDIETLAVICKKYNIPHLVNNAYGLQSQYFIKRIQKAHRKGRVDVFIQSTDKNLMVPVGGAIIACFDETILKNIASTYPGRASSSSTLDVFITLLNLGKNGYLKLVEERTYLFNYLLSNLTAFANSVNEEVIYSIENPISIAMTLKNIKTEKLTMLGSMLFLRCVSGCRIITTVDEKTIDGYKFQNWGSHTNDWNVPYLTAAAAIGVKQNDIDEFVTKLKKTYNKCKC